MSGQKPDGRLSAVINNEILTSPNSQAFIQQDEVSSDCPLLTPSPPPDPPMDNAPVFKVDSPTQLDQTLNNINCEDGLAYLNLVNSSCKPMLDEPSSRDPMLETSSEGGSSSDTNEPVCTQLLTQLNTAYTHLAPDAQALFYNQGEPPLTGIQLVVPKPPKNYSFMNWNWPIIRKTFFWTLMSVFAGCIALAIGVIATMPRKCEPPVQWWQGSLFYEIFPASFQDSYNHDKFGDFQGITYRLDYLQNLGVKTIRLNSIFPTKDYPQQYDKDIQSLTKVDPHLGNLEDFDRMVSAIHSRNMMLILDLPLYPFVKNFGDHVEKRNISEHEEMIVTGPLPSYRNTRDTLRTAPAEYQPQVEPVISLPLDDHVVTIAIRFWLARGVDGFYFKGLEHYVNETNFMPALRHWKSIVGTNKILVCSEKALNDALYTDARNAIMHRIDLVDVVLHVSNGTKNIKSQVTDVIKGPLFKKAGYPWIHWSMGSVDTLRLASSLHVANASVAIAMLGMMLPGTPSIFYGDELGLLNSENVAHKDWKHLSHLTFMNWDHIDADKKLMAETWMPISAKPAASNLSGLVPEMAKLRQETPSIYVNGVVKHNEPQANCYVRYTTDELIVIERWYPRRNTYVFVANLGMKTQTKDLSSLYYGGHVVVGPEHKLHRNIYFKELTITPGEAFIIKLDK